MSIEKNPNYSGIPTRTKEYTLKLSGEVLIGEEFSIMVFISLMESGLCLRCCCCGGDVLLDAILLIDVLLDEVILDEVLLIRILSLLISDGDVSVLVVLICVANSRLSNCSSMTEVLLI